MSSGAVPEPAPVIPVTTILAPKRAPASRRLLFSLAEGLKAHLRVAMKARQLRFVRIRRGLASARVVLVVVVKDEADRMPFFLDYYRRLGIDHVIVIDNCSTDDLVDIIEPRQDVSFVRATGSYGDARYGNDWVNCVLARYCRGRWVLYVDVDEFLVFDDSENRSIKDLADRLDESAVRAFSVRMIDMYSSDAVTQNRYRRGQDPLEVCRLFDADGYESRYEEVSMTTWLKGGPRGRMFFEDPQLGPALNKTPLVRWGTASAYLKSSHQLWPIALNRGSTEVGASGALLHQKFLSAFAEKVVDPDYQRQHTSEYLAYRPENLGSTFIGPSTRTFRSSSDLVAAGVMNDLGWSRSGGNERVRPRGSRVDGARTGGG